VKGTVSVLWLLEFPAMYKNSTPACTRETLSPTSTLQATAVNIKDKMGSTKALNLFSKARMGYT